MPLLHTISTNMYLNSNTDTNYTITIANEDEAAEADGGDSCCRLTTRPFLRTYYKAPPQQIKIQIQLQVKIQTKSKVSSVYN